jgi:hypothetical protein
MFADLGGQSRVRNGVVDMGAFENQNNPDPAVMNRFEVRSEPGQVRVVADLSVIQQGTLARVFVSPSPDTTEAILRQTELLPSGSYLLNFADTAGTVGLTAWYWLELIALDRGVLRFGPQAGSPLPPLPSHTNFGALAPNPFREASVLRFTIGMDYAGDSTIPVSLTLFDVQGALIRRLLDSPLPAGEYEIPWNGRNDRGLHVPAGVYYARLVAGNYRYTRVLLCLR